MNEDYDIASLAAYLHVTPGRVRKMVERGKLPGRRIGGQWRFSQAEIHEWFEEKIGLSDEQELNEVERVLERHPEPVAEADLHIPDLLAIDNVYVPLLARTKRSVIQRICDETAKTGRLWDAAKMVEAIENREQLHPTALENGVALLHPRRPMSTIIGDPFLAMGVTTTGIPFGGPRGCLTDTFFLIGSTSEQVHLRVLARLSRLIQLPELLDQLRAAQTPAEAWDCLAQADGELD